MRGKRVNPFIKAHGAAPGPLMRPKLTGILASFIAILITRSILYSFEQRMGEHFNFSFQTQIFSFALYSLLAGFIYGRVYRRAANDRQGGWLFGASTGYILWMFNPLIWLPWLGFEPIFVGRLGLLILFGHVLHGALLGLLYPWIHLLSERNWRAHLLGKEI